MQPGDRVAILALNSDRYFELLYAIPWLGAVVVPVNTRLATPEVRYILEDSWACVLFIDGAMKAHAAALAGQMPTVEAMFYLDDDAPPAGMRPYKGHIEYECAGPTAVQRDSVVGAGEPCRDLRGVAARLRLPAATQDRAGVLDVYARIGGDEVPAGRSVCKGGGEYVGSGGQVRNREAVGINVRVTHVEVACRGWA